jgi:translation initiation factor IF-2
MSEVNTPRLMAAAKEFNIGTSTLVDFLMSKGFNNEDLKPTSKLTEQMYRVLQ